MKRLIIAMLLVLAASAGLINYLETAASQSLRIEQAGGVVGRPINLPNDPRLSDPQAVLAIVRGGAEAAHVNVLRSLLGYTADGRQATTLFVLLTSDTRAFEPFRLQSGRWLTPADADFPSRYLSATPGGGPDQIGVLSVFGIQPAVSIRSLKASFDAMPVSGTYSVEAPDDASYRAFVAYVSREASTLTGDPSVVAPDVLTAVPSSGLGTSSGDPTLFLGGIQALIVLLTAIFLAFDALGRTKAAGVMRLHGFSAMRIWYEIAGRFVLVVLLAVELLAIPAALLVPGSDSQFCAAVLLGIGRSFALVLAASLVTCGYVVRSNIPTAIKN